jgi:O-antigen ligase
MTRPTASGAHAIDAPKSMAFLPAWLGTGAVLLVALVLGGGTRQGLWSDAIVQLLSLPLLGVASWEIAKVRLGRRGRAALWIAATLVLVPLFQLLPLPRQIWTVFPGRVEIAAGFSESGLAIPWLGTSLSPAATWRALFTFIPPLAIFLSVLTLRSRARRVLAYGVVGFAFLSVLLGLAQLAQGEDSALRFYNITTAADAVGFFANRNHFAALLYCALPITAAIAVGLAADRRPQMAVGLALCILTLATLVLGLGMARSRAGLALLVIAGFGSIGLARSWNEPSSVRRAAHGFLYLGTFVGAILVVQFASVGIMQRLDADLAENLRWELATNTLKAVRDYLPFGSGFGTFQAIYTMYEGADQLYAPYVNHAHNDFLEIMLEGGLPAALAVVAFLFWYFVTAFNIWRAPGNPSASTFDRSLPRAASVVVLLLLLHSLVDYPLRTTALASILALAAALMIPPARLDSDTPAPRQRRQDRERAPSASAALPVAG